MADLDPRLPFTTAVARAAGLKHSTLRGPRFRRLHRGVYVATDVPIDEVVRAHAALLTQAPGAFLSHESAADLQGIPVPRASHVHVSVAHRGMRRQHAGLALHVRAGASVKTVRGMRVSHGAELFAELARHLPLVDLVVAGDHMVRHGMCSLPGITGAVATLRGLVGADATRAVSLINPLAESAMESRVRMLLVLAGFPPPMVNVTVANRYRPDLCWPHLRLIVEYQGRQHRADSAQWEHDIARREWFDQHDWRILEFVARDVYTRPDQAIERVYAAWLERGGAPFRLSDEWRRHFDVRAAA
jgi:very-short-patch-repair endonuclease